MRKDNPHLQSLAGDDWPPTHTHYLRHEELEERLGAYCELSVKYGKCILELDAAQLIFDTNERHRLEYSLELLIQHITNRLHEILNILARDNMLRKRGKKCVYTLPRLNPRAATLNTPEDTHKLGKDIQEDIIEIINYAFKPIPEGEEDRISVCYDGSDIPDDSTRRQCIANNNRANPGSTNNNTNKANTGRNQDRAQHTVNFEDREHHRTSALEDIQQRLTQMAQSSSTNTENICPAHLNDNPKTTEDGKTWPKDTSGPTAKTTTQAQPVTRVLPLTGMAIGQARSAQLVAKKDTTQGDAEPN